MDRSELKVWLWLAAAAVLLAAGLAALFFHGLTDRRDVHAVQGSARMTVAAQNARLIALNAKGTGGTFPDDIAAIFPWKEDMRDLTMQNVLSPLCYKTVPDGIESWPRGRQDAWIRKNSIYILIPGVKNDDDAKRVLVFLRPEDAGNSDGIAVGFADVHSEWIRLTDARPLIEKQAGMTLEELIARQENYLPPTSQPSPP